MSLDAPKNSIITIPSALIWAQCAVFALLYGSWMIRHTMGMRRASLVIGAIMALYPIYRYRTLFFQKKALPVWLMLGFFAWGVFHLCFLSQDYPAQLTEFNRVWKYAALGGIFALGLGLSLASANKKTFIWPMIYFGLCSPLLIYLLKYGLTNYGDFLGITVPDYLKLEPGVTLFYLPKTDYVAFCLPVLAISLGQICNILLCNVHLILKQHLAIGLYLFVITATLFLFYAQDTKNGIAYAALLIGLFIILLFFRSSAKKGRSIFIAACVIGALGFALYPHLQKNHSWSTLLADTKVGLQLEGNPQWKFAGDQGLPKNEHGQIVSGTNYARVAWFKVGLQMAAQNPLGYGLVEDSFKKMAFAKWPDASPNLSHTHSGWLDLLLAVGFPGFFCILLALVLSIKQSKMILDPWGSFVFWSLLANLILWVTTEASATITFGLLIFWICWACALALIGNNEQGKPS